MIFLAIFFFELFLLFFLSRLLTRFLSKLLMRLTKSRTTTIQILSFLFLPGVIIHELSHLLTAGVLFVPLGEMEFVPKIVDNTIRLGSVGIGKTDPLRRFIIGISPVIVGVIIIFWVLFYFNFLISTPQVWQFIGVCYLLFEIGNTMFSSRKDLEGAAELLFIILIIFAIFYFIGFRLPGGLINSFFSENNLELFKKAAVFLSLPIIVDLGMIEGIYIFIIATQKTSLS